MMRAALLTGAGLAMAGSALAADINKGRELYATYCVGCHGLNGAGQVAGTPNFTQGNSLMKSDTVLADSIRNGRNAMPGFRALLTDAQLLDVVAYLRTLR